MFLAAVAFFFAASSALPLSLECLLRGCFSRIGLQPGFEVGDLSLRCFKFGYFFLRLLFGFLLREGRCSGYFLRRAFRAKIHIVRLGGHNLVRRQQPSEHFLIFFKGDFDEPIGARRRVEHCSIVGSSLVTAPVSANARVSLQM